MEMVLTKKKGRMANMELLRMAAMPSSPCTAEGSSPRSSVLSPESATESSLVTESTAAVAPSRFMPMDAEEFLDSSVPLRRPSGDASVLLP